MDDLNSFMKSSGLEKTMTRRLREYFHQTRHLRMAAANRDLINLMSPALQGEVVWTVNKRWLEQVNFLRAAEPEFMVQLALKLQASGHVAGARDRRT